MDKYQDFLGHLTRLNLTLNGFVDGNFDCKFYTFYLDLTMSNGIPVQNKLIFIIITLCIHLSVITPAKKLPSTPPISKNVTANPANQKSKYLNSTSQNKLMFPIHKRYLRACSCGEKLSWLAKEHFDMQVYKRNLTLFKKII